MTGLTISMALLWIVNIGLVFTVLALIRQIGVLHERVAPVGALTVDHGPKVGETAPLLTAPTLSGAELTLGNATGRTQMLFFLSPTCPVCKKLLPILRSMAASEQNIEIILASDGLLAEHQAFYKREKLTVFPYVLSTELGMKFRIPRLPYVVLIGPDARVKAKGLVNNREQLEGLLAASELGVASLQEYRARTRSQQISAAAAD